MATSTSSLHERSAPSPTPGPAAMTVFEHLRELRHRLLVSVATVAVGGILVFILFQHVFTFLLHPYCVAVGPGHSCNLFVTGPLDGLSIRLEVAAYGGLVLGSPVALFQLWRFIAPGLRPHERRYTVPFVTSSVALFVGGAAVAFLIFPHALAWLDSIGGPALRQLYSPGSYIGLLILMMAVFGIAFELPVLLVFLQLAHVVTPRKLASWRRIAIVILVAFAAIITPSSDPFSMFALAIPLVAFYEVSILIGRVTVGRGAPKPSLAAAHDRLDPR